MAVAVEELGYLDEPFNEAEKPEGLEVPNGKYICRVDSVDLKHNKAGDKLGFSQELVIVQGEYEGRRLFRWNGVPQQNDDAKKAMQQLGFLKDDLEAYGIDWKSPGFNLSSFLVNQRGDLLDRIVEVQVSKKADQQYANVYVNKLISADGATSQQHSAASAPEKRNPFKDE